MQAVRALFCHLLCFAGESGNFALGLMFTGSFYLACRTTICSPYDSEFFPVLRACSTGRIA